MKDFCKMTAQELADYSGPVFMARCTILHLATGTRVQHDIEAPTADLRTAAVTAACRRYGPCLSRTNIYRPKRQQLTELGDSDDLSGGCGFDGHKDD